VDSLANVAAEGSIHLLKALKNEFTAGQILTEKWPHPNITKLYETWCNLQFWSLLYLGDLTVRLIGPPLKVNRSIDIPQNMQGFLHPVARILATFPQIGFFVLIFECICRVWEIV
jgi:hypothetical protein